MADKLKLWNQHSSWEEAEKDWDQKACQAEKDQPIKKLKMLPSMVGITEDTAKGLKWKSTKWMIKKDVERKVLKGFLKHPFIYGWNWLKSIVKKKPYKREGDFFLYGIENLQEFEALLEDKDSLFVVGFSYCHKPFECPSGRFSGDCIHDPNHPVCRQCFIGKAMNALPDQHAIPFCIPTIHYIGGEIFDLIAKHPAKKIIFMITACELTLQMFGDWGNMVAIKGIGIRLDGRICNTMKAFELSEEGIKPGLTVILEPTQKKILELIRRRKESCL